MKLHVPPGPLPIDPPYFDWEEDPDLVTDDDEEIDLTDLFEKPSNVETIH